MAIAPVLKTGVRKDLGVRIPRPPLDLRRRSGGAVVVLEGFWKVFLEEPLLVSPDPMTAQDSTITRVFG